ncbi:MAG TPA: hypothetical protein VMF51_08405 [Nocardioides sp.]|uniref:hypothetical protein n=1 Tax=Nocardioides sp. TaxID=35761 RepID=UPI002C2E91F5|nr:hypothetical protein [Nocardioides sp.]HTW15137.1 hypothetical protein [Nocardioides sp.]
MAERKNFAVGETVEVPEGTVVRRPDGSERPVTGGLYVLDVPGTFVLGEREVTAK